MVRGFIFGTIFSLFVALAYWVSNKLPYNVDVGSLGFGLAIAALSGAAWAMLNGWWSTVTKPYRPMTITLETKQTPSQISFASIWAIAKGIIFIAIVIAVIVLMLSS
ncbi:MAG: hypothetical protein FJ009_03030 [Chloroflexi bacterium]|nr:hypothetical protein [Chloroflexota bacterium]